jgi:signal transduction histidine kinase
MEPDSRFVYNYMAAIQEQWETPARDPWVEYKLAQDFIANARSTWQAALVTIPLTFGLLYGHVNLIWLSGWLLMIVSLMFYRRWIITAFEKRDQTHQQEKATFNVQDFFKRHGWSWPASGSLFASPMFLYFEVVPDPNAYLCMMMLISMGAAGAPMMAARIDIQRKFAHALLVTSLLAVVCSWLMRWPTIPSLTAMMFVILIVLFWYLVLRMGRNFYLIQRNSYRAQFDKDQLIQSLRQQTLVATEAAQVKNNLLASATHDLRQPVHALAFYAGWLRQEPELASNILPKILAATDSVNTLFNSLFDFARIESGAIQVKMEALKVTPIIDELALQFAPAADQKGLSLRTHHRDAMVMSDPILLRRILSNLVANAIRYSDKGGVLISARQFGSKLRLEVWDSGVGIAPEQLPHVFKEFYRAPGHEGTADSFGLGLAIVQRLCRALGHKITIRSRVGKGTLCRVELNLANQTPTQV